MKSFNKDQVLHRKGNEFLITPAWSKVKKCKNSKKNNNKPNENERFNLLILII